MLTHSYDKAIQRLSLIMHYFSSGRKMTIKEMAKEFGVSTRTIQRDINERLHMFPIHKDAQGYFSFLDGFDLGRTSLDNEELSFFLLASSLIKNIDGKFQSTFEKIYQKLVIQKQRQPLYIKEELYESLDKYNEMVKSLSDAISYSRVVNFQYKNKKNSVEPYKLTCFDGLWYLFGKDQTDKKTKTFMLRYLSDLSQTSIKFVPPKDIENVLDHVHSAWFEDGSSYEVVIKVSKEIAPYFEAKKHLSSQNIIKKNQDDSLMVSFMVSHEEDIDNIIKSWLPHIQIISPIETKQRLEKELRSYISDMSQDFEIRSV